MYVKEEGLINEIALSNASFAVARTEELTRLLNDFDLTAEPEWAKVAFHLNSLSPVVLEGISTIYYLRHTETDESAVRERLLALKPHLKGFVDQCFDKADALRVYRTETATA